MKRLVSLLAVGALAAGALGCRPTPYARGFSRAVAETMVIEGAAESAREAARRRSGGNYSGMGGGSVSPQPVPRRIPKWSMDYPKSYLRTQEGLVLRGYVNSQGYFYNWRIQWDWHCLCESLC